MTEFRNKNIPNHISDIHEWIGDAVEFIGTSIPLVRKSTKNEGTPGALKTKNHRVALPSDFVNLLYVEYKGMELVRGGDKTGYGLVNAERSTLGSSGRSRSNMGGLILEDGTPVSYTDFPRLNPYNGEYYLLNPNYIQTSFEEGNIKLHYSALPVDDCGFPLIHDSPMNKRAIVWYVITMLLVQGYKHPIFTWELADAKWEEFMPRAQNELKSPSSGDMKLFKNMWVRMIPQVNASDTFFAGISTQEYINL